MLFRVYKTSNQGVINWSLTTLIVPVLISSNKLYREAWPSQNSYGELLENSWWTNSRLKFSLRPISIPSVQRESGEKKNQRRERLSRKETV